MNPLLMTCASLLGWTVLGFIFTSMNWVRGSTLNVLNRIILNGLLPFYIFMTMIRNFEMNFFLQHSWMILSQGIFIVLAALLILRWSNHPEKRYLFNLLAFQNAGYIPIPIIAQFPHPEQFLFLLFLLLMGFNLTLFSLGYWILNKKNHIRELLNVPLVASILGLCISILSGSFVLPTLPHVVLRGVLACAHLNELIMIPLILFVFGGTLVQHFHNTRLSKSDIPIQVDLALAKYVIIPLIMLVLFWRADKAVRLLMILQSLMPPAMNLLLLPEKENDIKIMSRYLMVQYIVFLAIVVPIFLSLFFILT
jgi:predicted permease